MNAPLDSLIAQAGLICVALNWTGAAVAIALQTDAFYDAIGSASTVLTMLASLRHLALSQKCHFTNREPQFPSCTASVLAIALVLLWTIRLGVFLVYRIYKMGEDSRMDKIKTNPRHFLVAWTAQAVWVFSITLPATVLASEIAAQGPGDVVRPLLALGKLLWVTGMVIAVPADWQKLQFRLNPENKGQFIRDGMFKYSRYPNYFGEIVSWTGMAVLCTSALRKPASVAMAFWSPVFTYVLLMYASGVPIQEKQAAKRWGTSQEYQDYKESTHILVPWPKRKAHSA